MPGSRLLNGNKWDGEYCPLTLRSPLIPLHSPAYQSVYTQVPLRETPLASRKAANPLQWQW